MVMVGGPEGTGAGAGAGAGVVTGGVGDVGAAIGALPEHATADIRTMER